LEAVSPQTISKSKSDEELLGEFLHRHEEQIGKVITAIAKNMEEGPKERRRNTWLVLGFMVAIVGMVSVLGFLRLISGDSLTSLIGSVVGYSFSFLRTYLGVGH